MNDRLHTDVVVLGAGAAGLAAAHYLVEGGVQNIIVLEASKRIGGRICTTEFGDEKAEKKPLVELGANWIHGMADNPVYKLALDKGLLEPLVLLDRIDGIFCSEDGRRMDKNLVNKLWSEVMKIEESTSDFFTNSIETSSNVLECFMARLEPIINSEFSPEDGPDLRLITKVMLNYLSFHIGDNLTKVSVQYDGCYRDIPGGDVKLPLGFTGVVETLTGNFPKDCIHLGSKVTDIAWNETDGLVRLTYFTDVDGEEKTYTCNHVIVTCSLGVLKKEIKEKTLFHPELPIAKCQAIEKMGFGKVNKIFLYYQKPFWCKGKGSVKLAWSGSYKDVEEKEEWYKRIFAFDEVLNNPNVLVAWISTNAAQYMEDMSDSVVCQKCTSILRQFLNDPSIPEPCKILRSSWCSNPLTLGSYSYTNMDYDPIYSTALAQPLFNSAHKPVVLFAGEATHAHWFSTVHGAFDSGKREAERLVQYQNKPMKSKV